MITLAVSTAVAVSVSGAVISEALADAYIDLYKKRNHELELYTILNLLVLTILTDLFRLDSFHVVAIYVYIRISLFNSTYNAVKGNSPLYRGETDGVYDKWMHMVADWVYATFILLSMLSALHLLARLV